MALWVCAGVGGCGTKYAVGLFRCPRCHNTEFHEDGDPMAKITRHGGPSDKTVPTPAGGALVTEPTPMAAEKPKGGAVIPSREALREHARNLVEPDFSESLARLESEEGGGESSPGSSSSASTEPQPTNSEPSNKPSPKRARGMGSRSPRSRTAEDSTVPSTAIDGQKTDGADDADS